MSMASALSNAISGITAASRGTEVVSANLANALTPGYGRRELELSPRILGGNGGGVHIDGVTRNVSPSVLSDLRQARAGLGQSTVSANFFKSLETSIGVPHEDGSLTMLLSTFDTSLVAAASRPDSDVRLRAVVESAQQLQSKIGNISDQIQNARSDADSQIGRQVDVLNASLDEVARLNRQIIVQKANGRDYASLQDARQSAIDRISSILPVQEVVRDNGRIALFTKGGAMLLDGKTPVRFGFEGSGHIVPQMTLAGGGLNQLTMDGETVTSAQSGFLRGGSLGALFELRDEIAPQEQARIDAFAHELISRFSDATVDPTLGPTDSGLFTDLGSNFDPANEVGIAQRLRLNTAVDPEQGGDLWRIRDGINATVPGDSGSSQLIYSMLQAISDVGPLASSQAPSGESSIHMFGATIISEISARRIETEAVQSHDQTLESSLQSALFENGVDSDREMEHLLALEKAYAANAKVIRAIDEMLDNILRI